MVLKVVSALGGIAKALLAFAARLLTLSKAIVDLPDRRPIDLLISPQKFVKDIETEKIEVFQSIY